MTTVAPTEARYERGHLERLAREHVTAAAFGAARNGARRGALLHSARAGDSQRLYALTKSDKVMLDTCWDVAALDPEQEGQRIAIMSSAWGGIGSWAS
jgi:hypothetical protein